MVLRTSVRMSRYTRWLRSFYTVSFWCSYSSFACLALINFKLFNSVLIKIQPDERVWRYLFTAKSLYMFRVSQHPSSGVLKTVTATSGTGHNIGKVTSLQRGLIDPTRCNSKQMFIYCKVTLHVSGVTAPIIRSTKNCNRSLRYSSYCKI